MNKFVNGFCLKKTNTPNSFNNSKKYDYYDDYPNSQLLFLLNCYNKIKKYSKDYPILNSDVTNEITQIIYKKDNLNLFRDLPSIYEYACNELRIKWLAEGNKPVFYINELTIYIDQYEQTISHWDYYFLCNYIEEEKLQELRHRCKHYNSSFSFEVVQIIKYINHFFNIQSIVETGEIKSLKSYVENFF